MFGVCFCFCFGVFGTRCDARSIGLHSADNVERRNRRQRCDGVGAVFVLLVELNRESIRFFAFLFLII